MVKAVREAVNINYSYGYLMLKTVKGAFNINY